jgi:hypothetical protein
MSNQPCSDPQASLTADRAALEYFQMAALLLGDEAQAVSAVETAIRESEVDPCKDPETAHKVVQERVVGAAIRLIAKGQESLLAAPETSDQPVSCLEEDDLNAAGISQQQLSELVEGSGRQRMRAWLEQLPPAQRVVFVLRAMSGLCNNRTSALLRENAGPFAGGWTPEAVSAAFRQALCSLTSLLVQSVQAPELSI